MAADNKGAGAITASFATGSHATSTDDTPESGGLVGRNTSPATVANSYWDTQTSGQSTSAAGTGKTTSELQTPAAYGTGSSIYASWNANLDGASGGDDPWDFGNANQYPTLKYGALTAADQRPALTLTLSPTTIWESNVGESTRATTATITATLSAAWRDDVAVTLPTNAAYALSAASIAFAAGDTANKTATLTADNNYIDAANKSITLTLPAHLTADKWVSTGTNAIITINDDDELTKPTGVKLSVDGTKMQVDWTAVTGATGYKVQWNTADSWTGSPTGTATISSGSTTTHKITSGLTADTTYYVRVLPTKSGADEPPSDVKSAATRAAAGTGDYDADNDGLIEIKTLAQLNAIRWDLDGDGIADDSSNQSSYDAAFPNAEDNMGCHESAVTIQSNDTGNPACDGYELAANLDFDDNTTGNRTDDTYYNSGKGWIPIGDADSPYAAKFDGNNATRTITNLHINASSTAGTSYAGLFGAIGTGAEIDRVALTAVSVTGSTTAENVYVGALAGRNQGTITESWSLGAVAAHRTGTGTNKDAFSGGLVGRNNGTIRASHSRAAVAATAHDANEGSAGGLVGVNESGATIAASYAAGDVTSNRGTDTAGAPDNKAYTGGLAALNYGTITASYATGNGTAVGKDTYMGGLVAQNASGATITASYSLGSQTAAATGGTANTGGFAATNAGTITASYWDTDTSNIADDTDNNAPEGKTTSELQTPAEKQKSGSTYPTGIYSTWNANVDGETGNDDPWDFGLAVQYPILKFGNHAESKQRALVTFFFVPTTIWERALTSPPRVNQTTVSVIRGAWHNDVTVTLSANAAYTLSAQSLTFAAGDRTTKTETLTAVNNFAHDHDKTVSLAATASDILVSVYSETITIKNDDELAKPAGVKLSVDGTKMQIDWTAVTGATGYKVQWNTSDSWTGSLTGNATISSGSTVTHKITSGLSADTTYYVRILPTKSGADEPPSDVVSVKTHATSPATADYDADNDGLIEITTLAQLNAIRWDLNGDGVPESANASDYATAFPNPEDNMGCNESAAAIASNNTGNPPAAATNSATA